MTSATRASEEGIRNVWFDRNDITFNISVQKYSDNIPFPF